MGKIVPQHWRGARLAGALCIAVLLICACAPDSGPLVSNAQETYKKEIVLDDAPNAAIAQGDASLKAKDYPSALKQYQEASADGGAKVRAAALNRMGELYEWGFGVDRDYSRSFDLYRKAALLGNANAEANLGNSLFFGTGTERNLKEALTWAQKGADADVLMAINQVGWQYLNGMGIPVDTAEARRRYERSAKLGDATGQLQYGWMYAHVEPLDYQQAMNWYEKAADQNDATAQNNIGYLYENGLGVARDYGAAAHWYQMSAAAGFPRAQYHLGILQASGSGVVRDQAKAHELMQKAAKGGDAEAALWLAGHP